MFMVQHPVEWGIISMLAKGSWAILHTSQEFVARKVVAEHLKRPASVIGLVADCEAIADERHIFVLDVFVRNFHRCDRAASILGLGHVSMHRGFAANGDHRNSAKHVPYQLFVLYVLLCTSQQTHGTMRWSKLRQHDCHCSCGHMMSLRTLRTPVL